MERSRHIEEIIVAAHALTRVAALATRNEAPAAQWRALSVLSSSGAMRVGELAAASRTTQPGMTRLVGQLVDDGLVTRASDVADSRVSIIEITDAGFRALNSWRVELSETLEPYFDDLDDDDWAALSRTADILASRIPATVGAAR